MELNQVHSEHEQASTSMKVVLLIFALVLVAVLGYLVWQQQTVTYDNGEVIWHVKKTTATTATTASATCPNYTNSTYGFTLTFTSSWTGCKFKTATVAGATATYYVEMPTTSTDTAWTTVATDHDAGYASLFALSVYTNAQWTAATAQATEIPTEVGVAGSYTIGYLPAQSYPTDLQTAGLASQVASIVATFKTTQ